MLFNAYTGTGVPIMVQLLTDINQAKMQAASNIAASVADAVSLYSNAMSMWSNTMRTPYSMPQSRYRRWEQTPWSTGPTAINVPVSQRSTVTLIEGDENYLAHVELPNVDPEEITVKASNERIDITAGNITEFVALPGGVRVEEIAAEYRDGILTLKVPKEAKSARREVRVRVGDGKSTSTKS